MAPAFEALIIFSGSVGKECVVSGYKHLFLLAEKKVEGTGRSGKNEERKKHFHNSSKLFELLTTMLQPT